MSGEYPESEKLLAAHDESSIIQRFLAWCEDEDLELMEMDETGEMVTHWRSVDRLLADYFEIDMDKVERERRVMLQKMREAQA